MSDQTPLIEVKDLFKTYHMGKSRVEVLKGLSVKIHRGEALCIMGTSGAGKSTLLHILGTLDNPTSGKVFFEGDNIFDKKPEALAQFRNQKMSFVFQFHHLLREFTALENVALPARIGGMGKKSATMKAEALLEELDIADRRNHLPSEMSGGEQQRVAISRALILDPDVLFADEPTGNLDSANEKVIEDLFFRMHENRKLTLVVVTHDHEFSKRFPRVLKLKDGKWTI